jgi:hypothetical protein
MLCVHFGLCAHAYKVQHPTCCIAATYLYACRPSFDVILSKLLVMRHALSSAPTPALQRYKLQPKCLLKDRSKSNEAKQQQQQQGLDTEEVGYAGCFCCC